MKDQNEFLPLGGIGKNFFFPIYLKKKHGETYKDEFVYPYIINLHHAIDYPTAEIIINNHIKTANIGLEFSGVKYHFNEDMELREGEMNSELGIYLPLIQSEYYISPINKNSALIDAQQPVPVLGLNGTLDRVPLYLFLKGGLAIGFFIKDDAIKTFTFTSTDPLLKFVIYASTYFSSSILHNQINIPKKNLEGKVLKHSRDIPHPIQLKESEQIVDWKNPKSVISYLDRYLIGQNDAKKKVAISLKKYRTRVEADDESIEKGNLLLIGPTGTGKTMLMELIAKGQNIPFVNVKTTAKSQTGYVGENLCHAIFRQLIEKIKLDPGKKIHEPSGIIFIDEFDKLGSDKRSTADMFTKLQQEIVGWAEKDNVSVDVGGYGNYITINTKNLLFVGAGAFSNVKEKQESLIDIVRARVCHNNRIGFDSSSKKSKDYTDEELLSLVKDEDLERYGLMPELVGRFPERAIFNYLKPEELASIFCNVKDSIYESYKKIIEHDGYTLKMNKEVPMLIAEKCSKQTGARAIKTLASCLFNDIIYEPEKFSNKNKVIELTSKVTNDILSKSFRNN